MIVGGHIFWTKAKVRVGESPARWSLSPMHRDGTADAIDDNRKNLEHGMQKMCLCYIRCVHRDMRGRTDTDFYDMSKMRGKEGLILNDGQRRWTKTNKKLYLPQKACIVMGRGAQSKSKVMKSTVRWAKLIRTTITDNIIIAKGIT